MAVVPKIFAHKTRRRRGVDRTLTWVTAGQHAFAQTERPVTARASTYRAIVFCRQFETVYLFASIVLFFYFVVQQLSSERRPTSVMCMHSFSRSRRSMHCKEGTPHPGLLFFWGEEKGGGVSKKFLLI